MGWPADSGKAVSDMGVPEDHDLLIRVDANLTSLTKKLDDFVASDETKKEKADERITNLEKKVYALTVLAATLGMAGGTGLSRLISVTLGGK